MANTHTPAVFRHCCKECGGPVDLVQLPGRDLAYECRSPRCGKTVMVETAAEALGHIDRYGRRLDLAGRPVVSWAAQLAMGVQA